MPVRRPGGTVSRSDKRKDLGAEGRFRIFGADEVKKRGFKLDLTWLRDETFEESDELPDPQDLANDAIVELELVTKDLRKIVEMIEREESVAK